MSDTVPELAACDDPLHCVTCSDEAVPMVVVEGGADGVAPCEDASGRRFDVLVGLVGRVGPGDRLLVHAGAALARLPVREAG